MAADPPSLANLRILTPAELEALLRDRVLDDEWAGFVRLISDIIDIPDGTTGGVNPGDRRALYYLARRLGGRSVLEVGTNVGASTVHMAAALKRSGTDASLVTVDIVEVNDAEQAYWRSAGLSKSPRDVVQSVGADTLVEFVVEDSLRYLSRTDRAFDLIFLDGDHATTTVYQEIPLALNRLRPGGSIILHDYFPDGQPLWPDSPAMRGPYLAVQRLRRDGTDLTVLPLGELPWPTKMGTSVTSLALVTRSP